MKVIHTFLKKLVLIGTMALLVALFISGTSVYAEEDVLDYFFNDLVFVDEVSDNLNQQMHSQLKNGQIKQAIQLAGRLIDNNIQLSEIDSILYGKLLTNLGILFSYDSKYQTAMQVLDQGLQSIEKHSNPFDKTLINVTMVRGLTQSSLNYFVEAEESFRRAQHISHRVSGVNTIEQMEIINYIIQLDLKQGKLLDADREQQFNLRISERAYGKDGEELLPILQRIGAYFALRGNAIPLSISFAPRDPFDPRVLLFRQSINLYGRAIKIIEDNYGVNDMRLVEPLRGLARARLLQFTNRWASEAALERALHIVQSNPNTDITDRVNAMINLGDIYTIDGNKKASRIYLQAWQMMQEDNAFQQLSADLFGTPTRLYPEIYDILYLTRRPHAVTDEDVELYIDVTYTVRKDGRVSNIKLIDKNVPNAEVRYMRIGLSNTRFRPRIVDGELLSTQNLMIHQTYEVIENG